MNNNYFHEDEKPLLEFPAIMLIGITLLSVGLGLSLLFLPWYFTFLGFFSLAIIVAIFINPYIGVLIFLMGSYLHPTIFLPPQFASLHLARNLAFVVLFVWVFHTLVYKDFKMTKSIQTFFVLGYAFMLFFSCFKYFDYSFSLYIEQAIKFLILYFVIINLVKTSKDCIGIIWTIVILATIASLIGMYQCIFNIGTSYYGGRVRITGTEKDPNLFGMQIALAIPLVLNLFWVYKSKILKMFLMSIFALLLIATVFTYSRTALVALGIVLFLTVMRPIFLKPRNFTPLICLILVCLILLPFIPQEYWQRAKSITDFKDIGIHSRLNAWKLGWQMIKQNPFRGVGFGLFKYEHLREAIISEEITGGYETALHAHNSFIEVTAEAGIIAFSFLALLIFWTFKNLREAQRIFYVNGDKLLLNISMGLEISLIGYLVGAMFLSYLHLLIFWIIIPMGVVFKKVSLQNSDIKKS